jgi:hypothetical protein
MKKKYLFLISTNFIPKIYNQARKYKIKKYMVIKLFVIVINTINIFSLNFSFLTILCYCV